MHTQHRYTSTNKETKDNLCNSTKSLYQWEKATLSANTSGRCRTHPLPAAKCKCYKKKQGFFEVGGLPKCSHTHKKRKSDASAYAIHKLLTQTPTKMITIAEVHQQTVNCHKQPCRETSHAPHRGEGNGAHL